MNIPIDTKRFINAVTNPFDCGEPARIPDNDAQMSMSFKDYSIQNGYTMTINTTTTVAYGVAIYFLIGSSQLAQYGVIAGQHYTLVISLLDASGIDIGTQIIPLSNYSNILNYVLSMRFVGGGIRCKCLIEDVTVSTTVAVSRMYAGLLKPSDIYNTLNNNLNFYNVAQQMDCVKAFDNSEGATVRFDPFQQIVDFKKYRSSADWQSYYSYNGNTYSQPVIVSQFMNPIPMTTTGGNSTYTIPLIIEAVLWIEGLLQKPSPLYLTASPTDLNYEKIAEVISTACEGVFPIVTKFNSFRNFMVSLGRLGIALNGAVQRSTFLPAAKLALSAWSGKPSKFRNKRKIGQARRFMKRNRPFKPFRKFANRGNNKRNNFKSAKLFVPKRKQYRKRR